MTPTKKKNGRTVTAEKSSKPNQLATQIVAVRDRLTLGMCRLVASENVALGLVLLLAGCIGVLVEVFK